MNAPTHNRLLNALPGDVLSTLLPLLERVRTPVTTPMFDPEQPPRFVHFLESGIASVVNTMKAATLSKSA